MRFFLRLELLGRYLEIGALDHAEPEQADPVPDNHPTPIVEYAPRPGFRVTGDGGYTTDHSMGFYNAER